MWVYPFKNLQGYQEFPTPTEDEMIDFFDPIEVVEDFSLEKNSLQLNKQGAVIVVDVAPSKFHQWNGESWVISDENSKQLQLKNNQIERAKLLNVSEQKIADLTDVIELEMEVGGEPEALREWKKYKILLNRIDLTDPKWPEIPS